ncbi:hypothetical protein [Salinarimonas ramus]|uniref:Uncharacterized protein n=1 Tax=Salinarimonas ramus TaxID=690164 RepID=A0A917V2M1_9HYPH|nr:hypothetical protein [Salinarimonas ramus]GGK25154.1 hypothetical protein GCM10011322_09630 [Salinarimonas ramus]
MTTSQTNQNSFLYDPRYWGGTAIGFGGGAYSVLREIGIAALGNVPQARLAKTLFEINGIVISLGLGAAGGGLAGSPINGIAASALGIAATGAFAAALGGGVTAIAVGVLAAAAFDLVLTQNGIDLGNLVDPNSSERQKIDDFSQAIQDLVSDGLNSASQRHLSQRRLQHGFASARPMAPRRR